MEMIITQNMIEKAVALSACEDAVTWLRESPRMYPELVIYNQEWAVWAWVRGLVPREWAKTCGHLDCDNNYLCEGCKGCVDCVDCKGCVDCLDCKGCKGCVCCVRCVGCKGCEGCLDCKGCEGAIDVNYQD